MGTRRRLSKRQLKQDKFVSSTFELAQFVQQHLRRVVIGLAVLGATTGGILYYRNYREHQEERAAKLLATGRLSYEAENFPLAISDLEKVLEDFSGTAVGQEARILLADSHYQMGNYEETRRVLLAFTGRHGRRSPLAFQAYMLLGMTQENLGDYEGAARSYTDAEGSARFDYQRIEARFGAARAYWEAEKGQDAIEEYRTVIERFPDSPEAQRAEFLLAEVEARTQTIPK